MSLLMPARRESGRKDAEILMLRHQLAVAGRERPKARARFAWPDRAWLALLAGTVPAGRLAGMRPLVTSGTILRWHRDIVRRRRGHLSRRGRPGRPATHRQVRPAGLRLARENESWGCRRIHGELAGPGITVAPSTVREILKNAGIDPAPRRDGPGRAEFPRSPAQGILALDLFTAGLLNGAKAHVLAVIEHGTRRARIPGATEHPVQARVVRQARNLLMDPADAGTRVKFMIHDRDASFTTALDEVFRAAGTRIARSAIRAPRVNSVTERRTGSCRRELPDRTPAWNQRHLMTVLREYEDFCNTRRPHRALKQAAPLRRLPGDVTDPDRIRVQRPDRAGRVIHEHRLVEDEVVVVLVERHGKLVEEALRAEDPLEGHLQLRTFDECGSGGPGVLDIDGQRELHGLELDGPLPAEDADHARLSARVAEPHPTASAAPRSKTVTGAPVSIRARSVQSPVSPYSRRTSTVGRRTGGLPSSRYGRRRYTRLRLALMSAENANRAGDSPGEMQVSPHR